MTGGVSGVGPGGGVPPEVKVRSGERPPQADAAPQPADAVTISKAPAATRSEQPVGAATAPERMFPGSVAGLAFVELSNRPPADVDGMFLTPVPGAREATRGFPASVAAAVAHELSRQWPDFTLNGPGCSQLKYLSDRPIVARETLAPGELHAMWEEGPESFVPAHSLQETRIKLAAFPDKQAALRYDLLDECFYTGNHPDHDLGGVDTGMTVGGLDRALGHVHGEVGGNPHFGLEPQEKGRTVVISVGDREFAFDPNGQQI